MDLDATAARSARAVSRSAVLLWSGALLTIALHLAFAGLYGYQRDELYFIACAKHIAWGYVDQPPLIALITQTSLRLFGDSVSALRIFPALAAGALVALVARLTARLGGDAFAVGVAMIGVALSPFNLAVGNLLTMNAFEPLLWLALTVLVYAQIDAPRAWRWTAIGAVAGVGFLNKWSMGVYAVCLLCGVLISPARKILLVPGLGLAVAIAAAIAGPNLAWQAVHGWPQLTVLHNADLAKNARVSPLAFMLEQLPLTNPFAAPLWMAGLFAALRSKRYTGIALAYIGLIGIELVLHGKVYYVAPIYPALVAAGAVAFERATRRRLGYRVALAGAIVVAGLAIMPLATPALPLSALLDYQRALDVRTLKMEKHPTGRVPQQFADQLGWDELEATIARVVDELPTNERATAAILTGDYGQAAALDFLGRRDALPPAISGHNQYYLWGPQGEHAVVVAVGVPQAVLAREYDSIERVATYRSTFVLPQNSNLGVYLCRRPRIPLVRFWPQLQRYI